MRKTFKILSTVAVCLLAICAVLMVGARLLGLQVFTVVSGSMQPTYQVGDLIYVKKTDPEDIRVGDVITFVMNKNLVIATHRVVGVDETGCCFITKGDHNAVADSAAVYNKNVIGRPVFRIPYLGYLAGMEDTLPGKVGVIVVSAGLLLVAFLPELVGPAKKKEEAAQTV